MLKVFFNIFTKIIDMWLIDKLAKFLYNNGMRKFAYNLIIIFTSCLILLTTSLNVSATQYYGSKSPKSHIHSEQSYQKAWQKKYGGILEYRNDDSTRVDCLTDTHAIEFDFANKWAEAIGQALYYQHKTGKRAKVVLILENPQAQMKYYNKVKELSKIYNFDVEYITPAILGLNANNQCQNPKCKCHKKNLKYKF